MKLPPVPAHLGEWQLSTVGGPGVTDRAGNPVRERPCLWHTRTAATVAPRILVGDRLYVREAWRSSVAYDDLAPSEMGGEEPVRYEADGATERWTKGTAPVGRLRQAMHMPRWASRTTLLVDEVRIERLQDISEADVLAEGAFRGKASGRYADNYTAMAFGDWFASARGWYKDLWERINGNGAWDANPWITALTFRVIDQVGL